MKKQFTVAILGCGGRGGCYASHMVKTPEKYKIVALCDPLPAQLKAMHDLYGLEGTRDFADDTEILREKLADILVIASPDHFHIEQAVKGMRLGYDLLLEKPISDNREELELLLSVQKETGRTVMVCHELRYGKGYLACGDVLRSGRLGRLFAIDASERVGYWHWIQAYVKGPGASLAEGFPTIFAKCSHDLDLLQSFAGSKCKSISSVGDRTFFTKENAPKGATPYCLDCPHKDSCVFSAKRIYVDGWHKAGEPRFVWPYNKVCLSVPMTEEGLLEGLRGRFGRCAFLCEPEQVVDHQLVQATFENGVKASLKMLYAYEHGRRYAFYCTEGEMIFDERLDTIEILPFGGEREVIRLSDLVVTEHAGHGGGDAELVRELYEVLSGEHAAATSLAESIESHLMGAAAEESRKANGACILVHS